MKAADFMAFGFLICMTIGAAPPLCMVVVVAAAAAAIAASFAASLVDWREYPTCHMYSFVSFFTSITIFQAASNPAKIGAS